MQFHFDSISRKLGASNRQEAIARAVQTGIVRDELSSRRRRLATDCSRPDRSRAGTALPGARRRVIRMPLRAKPVERYLRSAPHRDIAISPVAQAARSRA